MPGLDELNDAPSPAPNYDLPPVAPPVDRSGYGVDLNQSAPPPVDAPRESYKDKLRALLDEHVPDEQRYAHSHEIRRVLLELIDHLP